MTRLRPTVSVAALLLLLTVGGGPNSQPSARTEASPALAAATTTPGSGAAFTIAVLPDTQQEVLYTGDRRMRGRNSWLVGHRGELDLRFVTQVGDLTNWGWLEPSQLATASDAFGVLDQAGIPYSIAVGNHDTRAVGWDGDGGYGGSAYEHNPECRERFPASECDTPVLVRRTQEINAVFDAERFGAVRGAYEPGKIDNVYSTFSAGGFRWLMLSLELWPRAGAVAWADDVVAAHPHHNVIVTTHHHLSSSNTLSSSADYGSTSPQRLWSAFLSRHPNVRMVLSGHVGSAGSRLDRGVHGNRVLSLRTTFHSTTTNPVRLVTIRPYAGVVRTRILGPATGTTWPSHARTVEGMRFVRPPSGS